MSEEWETNRHRWRERHEVEILDAAPRPGVFVVVTDAATGKRLSGSAPHHAAPSMVGCLIEDHRKRAARP